MQEWLKDKKNTPIIAALLAVLLLGSGGLIAFEMGAFGSGPDTSPATPLPGQISAARTPPPRAAPTGPPPSPVGRPPLSLPRGAAGRPAAAPPAAAVAKKPDNVNPAVGPDPFRIPNGTKIASSRTAKLLGPKPALRDAVGPLNLFQLRPQRTATTPLPPIIPDAPDRSGAGPASRYRLSGIINGPDGINAILEVDGQSQSAKPGDSLSDGTRVTNIQASSVTVKTAAGSIVTLPISAAAPPGANGSSGLSPGFAPSGFSPSGFPPPGFSP